MTEKKNGKERIDEGYIPTPPPKPDEKGYVPTPPPPPPPSPPSPPSPPNSKKEE